MTIKAILWDLDGVLVRTESLYCEATRRVMSGLGHHRESGDIASAFLRENRDLLEETMLAEGQSRDDYLAAHHQRTRLLNELIQAGDIKVEGAAETVAALERHFVMAVVTGSKRTQVEAIAGKLDFFHCFKFVIALEDAPDTKPAPAPYLAASARINVAPGECLAIEDSPRGVRAAKSAGMTCWAIPNALNSAAELSEADRILDNIMAVKQLLPGGVAA